MLRSLATRAFSTASGVQTKLNHPTRRAGHLMTQLHAEEVAKATERIGANLTKFKPGDAVEVEIMLNKSTQKTQRIKGVVIAERNRGISSSFTIRNHIAECGYEQTIFKHSPLLVSVKMIKEKFISNGKKRARRAKLFYLRDKAPRFTTL
ncbi:ribosomal protein L19 [Aphanomyces astaci]|uniref:50S ribosomal protein L19, chloroplastic n=1 Tax=Aphanomyces astaci TaxID=112090 RepID=W4FEI5_APHAT|nr:ribosomal protein L19 [Aphanomyces astaci]ETV65890.1 ribosomal protein L19 [Aphanomyces astaci]RHY65189.1 hypothetical protein DYB38_006166 [Aphanomyces astaci]RHY69358.1 hypothetical protein DYB30_006606 [Aphanomyces astaci]RHZ19038.1 hypothetical protein DYB26_002135 [Aphanomyces astaci]RQM26976.1 hypothetical protein B5M09_005482 [Aphanomyces astaci]|eukprot:XP_009844643.1 ribosomal protein L19 [Aphanomyces astaci]